MSEDTSGAQPHPETELIGAWLLGGLEPAEVGEMERHLATCAACRTEAAELEPLVAVLGEVDPEAVRPAATTPPAALDARIEAALGARPIPLRRRRTWVAAVGGLAVGAAAAAALVVAVRPGAVEPAKTPAPVVAIADVRSSDGVTASAGYVDHTWGVELQLEARGLPAGRSYQVQVIDNRGRAHEAGAFLGVARSRTVDCDVNASVLKADASRFVVTGPSGRTVIEGELSS